MQAKAKDGEEKNGEGEQDQAPGLLLLLRPATVIACVQGGSLHGRWLLARLIDEIVDAKLEVGAVELWRQRRELADAGDGAPGRAI